MLTVHPSLVTLGVPRTLPVVVQNVAEPGVGVQLDEPVYLSESAKYASSAVTKLRRSDFIEAMYAFSFVFANFGIAIAARMPMMTTTIRSSISVNPFLRLRTIFYSWKKSFRDLRFLRGEDDAARQKATLGPRRSGEGMSLQANELRKIVAVAAAQSHTHRATSVEKRGTGIRQPRPRT